VLEKEENEDDDVDGCCRCEGKWRNNRWRGRSMVERMVVMSAVTMMVVEGHDEERKKREKNVVETREEAIFFVIFIPLPLTPIYRR
jgi:hypothetical protein